MIYIQIACTYTEDQLEERRLAGLLIGIISILIALLLVFYADFVKAEFQKEQHKWDD